MKDKSTENYCKLISLHSIALIQHFTSTQRNMVIDLKRVLKWYRVRHGKQNYNSNEWMDQSIKSYQFGWMLCAGFYAFCDIEHQKQLWT